MQHLIGNDNIGSKIVTVVVSKNKTAPMVTSMPTLIPTPTKAQPTCAPSPTHSDSSPSQTPIPETSGFGFWMAIAVFIIVVAIIKRKIKY